MPINLIPNTTHPAVNLNTQLWDKEHNKYLDVQLTSNLQAARVSGLPFIYMTSNNNYVMALELGQKEIGSVLFNENTQHVDFVENLDEAKYKYIGKALMEAVCRLALSNNNDTVHLKAIQIASLFHYKLGFRSPSNASNDQMKNEIAHKRQLSSYKGVMSLKIRQAASTPDSPHLLNTLLAQTPALLEPTTLEL
ncbi:MAG: hypothetical protein VX185_05620 [Pseudomonadota bacterium]|nr:hypothetical protein [Pseudomonadota bacterium]